MADGEFMKARWLALVAVLCLVGHCFGAWHDPDSKYRRELMVEWSADKITAEHLVSARFLLNGKQLPDAADLQVTTLQGKPVPYRVLGVGPGDMVEVVFNAVAGTRQYYAYFGSKTPRKSPEGTLNNGGLIYELKTGTGANASDAKEAKTIFDKAGKVIGARTLSRLHMGNNLFGAGGSTATRVAGHIFAPIDGTYVFALTADDRAALWIDGQPLVFSRNLVGDARFQERLKLTRGWHEFTVYQLDFGGDYRLSAYWKRPDMESFDVIANEFFGTLIQASPQALETQGQTLTADFTATYQGEAFYADRYSHRYRFELASVNKNDRTQAKWSFGDGQTGTGRQIEHVFLNHGVQEITLQVTLGATSDTQVFHMLIDRDFDRMDNPPTDELGLHAKLVATYDLKALKPDTLAQAIMMFLRTKQTDQAFAAGKELARAKEHQNWPLSIQAIKELREAALEMGQPNRILEVYSAVAADSQLQPRIAIEYAQLLLYGQGDFATAERVISPYAEKEPSAKRLLAQSLVLTGQLEKARKLFAEMPVTASQQKSQALSGAMARTTDYHIREKQVEAAEESWEKWMSTFPGDFLDGNAALLRVQIITAEKHPLVAAKVAEAYANANPQSTYAPTLLFEAAKLLESSDAAKAQELRSVLRQRYPEDPLSQEKK